MEFIRVGYGEVWTFEHVIEDVWIISIPPRHWKLHAFDPVIRLPYTIIWPCDINRAGNLLRSLQRKMPAIRHAPRPRV